MSGFQPDQGISVSLPSQQWDHVLAMMAKQPYEVSAPLIGEIQRQRQMAEMRQRMPGPSQQLPRLVPEGYGPIGATNEAS